MILAFHMPSLAKQIQKNIKNGKSCQASIRPIISQMGKLKFFCIILSCKDLPIFLYFSEFFWATDIT